MASDATPILSEPEMLRDHLVQLLEGKGDFGGAKILSWAFADLRKEITRSLAKDGLMVAVILPAATVAKQQSASAKLQQDIIVRVVEAPLLNRKKTGKSAHYITSRVVAHFNNHRPPFDWCGSIQPKSPGMRQLNVVASLDENDDSDDYDGWDAFFETWVALLPRESTN